MCKLQNSNIEKQSQNLYDFATNCKIFKCKSYWPPNKNSSYSSCFVRNDFNYAFLTIDNKFEIPTKCPFLLEHLLLRENKEIVK